MEHLCYFLRSRKGLRERLAYPSEREHEWINIGENDDQKTEDRKKSSSNSFDTSAPRLSLDGPSARVTQHDEESVLTINLTFSPLKNQPNLDAVLNGPNRLTLIALT